MEKIGKIYYFVLFIEKSILSFIKERKRKSIDLCLLLRIKAYIYVEES